jgi:predicted adenylyl cyclase CyaB
MFAEIEIKFLNQNYEEFTDLMKKNNAQKIQHRNLFKRVIYSPIISSKFKSFLRLRTNWKHTTLTYKILEGYSVDGIKELETTVGDFEITKKLLSFIGLDPTSYQENYREIWKIKDTEICFDERPMIKPYVEIESPTLEELKEICNSLGYNYEEWVFGTVDNIYEQELWLNKEEFSVIPYLVF